MDSDYGVDVTVLVGPDAGRAKSLGKHVFVAVPRVGEHLFVADQGKDFVLEVTSVAHFGHSLETPPGRIQPLRDFSVQVICKEV